MFGDDCVNFKDDKNPSVTVDGVTAFINPETRVSTTVNELPVSEVLLGPGSWCGFDPLRKEAWVLIRRYKPCWPLSRPAGGVVFRGWVSQGDGGGRHPPSLRRPQPHLWCFEQGVRRSPVGVTWPPRGAAGDGLMFEILICDKDELCLKPDSKGISFCTWFTWKLKMFHHENKRLSDSWVLTFLNM